MDKEMENLLCCPGCSGQLETAAPGYKCPRCNVDYPEKDGILSFIGEESPYWQTFFEEQLDKAADTAEAVGYSGKKNFQIVHHAVEKILAHPKGKMILDVGCGNGVMTGWLTGQNTVVGVDFTFPMLQEARERAFIPIHADAMKLPFKPKLFAYVLAVEIIQHIEDGIAFVQYLSQFVKGKGKMVISGLNSHSILRRTYRGIRKITRTFPQGRIPVLWNPIVLAEALKERGFAVDILYTCFPAKRIMKDRDPDLKKRWAGANFFIIASNIG